MSRRLRRSSLLVAIVVAVVLGVGVTAAAWWLLRQVLGVAAEPPSKADLTRFAFSVTVGVGGVVGLVVAYRRQRDAERGRFAELFGAAARQLGDPDAAVRMAGVYAMAGVADEFATPGRRQQCIDVLCGYLRLPYEPESGASHLAARTETSAAEGTTTELKYQLRANDREVRRAIVDVISAHLRPAAEVSWSERDFDFADAVLEDPDFRYAVFDGERTYFARTVFTGLRATTFESARFTGRYVNFRNAEFRGALTLFRAAEFAPREPRRGEQRGSGVVFSGVRFGSPVSFQQAVFRGERLSFPNAGFLGPHTTFTDVRFLSGHTDFTGATFGGDETLFDKTEFGGERISFAGVQFYADRTTFAEARLGVRSRWRRPGTAEIDFGRVEYHGTVSFADAALAGAAAYFTRGDFFGEISFRGTKFGARVVDFDKPKSWVGVLTDWDEDPSRKPDHIAPALWPPIPPGATPV
ncbi:pentapeptide repeat-containing protein [Nocardia sp. alder85J]|uniref:pentapeptide repeat-containing protein n=1 Tax=Nocardia sp. alder85J TaxID=2862949 RepID=UPI001CD6187C|nr:pentapeptide repeat-containing protein [Nocardia sp. alder85J]MCX4094274.1 pentapeptide repeat-containing protein [Nocardia sp. alder85J]